MSDLEKISMPEAAAQANLRGEIDGQQFRDTLAIWCADNLGKYKPEPFKPLAPSLKQYAERRVKSQQNYDPAFAKILGEWVRETFIRLEQFQADFRNLEWANGRLKVLGLVEKAEKIGKAITAYRAFETPDADLLLATHAQKLDSDHAQRTRKEFER